ncbi:integrase [Niveispirillum cyanobacteriorum]|uniref:Integrase n=1 Tax=Niveispirillum cyanobacteriorum TaxID=1612173 RepID=A0A2K9N8K3_9PROT|nr:integrase [Niveispirillum cyanobacteriorum]AUN29468.1 integrase [Niveispirillum cyanobacteriorum]GGE63846.1 DNA-binding protein [Niveispirillum cyanobacteriorum]
MTTVVHFVPNAQATAEANLAALIKIAKPLLKAYPEVLSWEENNWDLRGTVQVSGIGDSRVAAAFTSFDSARKSQGQPKAVSGWMSEPFRSFAKAYFLYTRALVGKVQLAHLMASLRVLEKALIETHGDSAIHRVTPVICNRAVELIRERFEEATAYRVGCALERLAGFMVENRLANPFKWNCQIRRPREIRTRVGKAADEARSASMPSQAALEALPRCFNIAVEPRDIIASSVAALLCTAPDRIGEVFGLRANCEVEEIHKGKPIYGLRWLPEKGAEPMVKWIAPTMVEVAKAAIAKLREVSRPAREIAAWYEQHPDQIYLPRGTEYLRTKKYLLLEEVTQILGLAGIQATRSWVNGNNVPTYDPPTGKRSKRVRFDELQSAVLAKLPKGFPVIDKRTGLKYSEALIVVRQNEMHAQRGTILCLVEPVTTGHINDALGGKEATESMFDRFGFTESDGSRIKVHSHQFRHWLNTLAHRGGMSQLDIAKWSGRKDIRQNQDYNHMAPEEFLAMARDLTIDDKHLFGGLAELVAKAPISRDEFMMLEYPTAHVTELGFCVHDFTALPCEKHRDCVQCNEHICVKGDGAKTARIKEQLALAEAQLEQAKKAAAEGYYGAERWQEHHQATVDRLRILVGILDDPAVPAGSLIRLTNPKEFSPIRLAVQDRMLIEGPDNETFNDLQDLLGGD